ncbi:nuclease [Anopheles sinensis]|uniref:Nuclease n=1 Tax=Anopheles sinensis TaxID=74873 RepID=A0A084WK97_ANOSI|nr:nuclease [Anopheles sinensis]
MSRFHYYLFDNGVSKFGMQSTIVSYQAKTAGVCNGNNTNWRQQDNMCAAITEHALDCDKANLLLLMLATHDTAFYSER